MTFRRQLLVVATLVTATLAATRAVSAQSTVHTSLAAFVASTTGPLYTETFPFITPSTNSSYSFSSLGFAYTVTAGGSTLVYRSSAQGSFIGNFTAAQSLIFTFTSGNVTAVGGNFFLTDGVDAFQSGNIGISLSDGTIANFTGASISDFRGFTTSGAFITSLTLAAPVASRFNSVDNFVVGRAASVVPEPSTYALMAAGLAGLFGVARRRNRAG